MVKLGLAKRGAQRPTLGKLRQHESICFFARSAKKQILRRPCGAPCLHLDKSLTLTNFQMVNKFNCVVSIEVSRILPEAPTSFAGSSIIVQHDVSPAKIQVS